MITQTKMESQSHKVPTYFVYEEREGGYGEIVGPVFPEEIDDIKADVFAEKHCKIDQECVFKALHYDQYKKTFQEYWVDFVARLLDSLSLPFEYEIEHQDGLDEDPEYYDNIANEIYEDENEPLDLSGEDEYEEVDYNSVSIVSEYLTINKDVNGHNKLFLAFSVELSPYWVSHITKELVIYADTIFDIEFMEPFYLSNKGEVIVGNPAFIARVQDYQEPHMN